jgi:hypothetical protein
VPESEYLLVLGSFRSVCVADLLRDGVLCCLPFDCSWLLYLARAALGIRAPQHRWSRLALVLDPHRLQGGCFAICCESLNFLAGLSLS